MRKKNLSILVVDDDDSIANMLVRFIERCGHFVESAGSCDEAIDKLFQNDFDLAFIDVNLPDGNGMELMKKAQIAFPEFSKISVVAMSGGVTLNEEIEIREQRVMFFMIKPFTKIEIDNILDHVEKRKRMPLHTENISFVSNTFMHNIEGFEHKQ